jgi:hypothetical protein
MTAPWKVGVDSLISRLARRQCDARASPAKQSTAVRQAPVFVCRSRHMTPLRFCGIVTGGMVGMRSPALETATLSCKGGG